MLNRLTDYYRTHQRSIKKQLRTNYTRPIKDKIHSYQVYFIRELSEFKATFFQAKNLRFLGIFVILFWLYRDFAFATWAAGADSGTTKTSETMNATVDVLNGVIFIVALIAQPIVMFIWWLLSPDWTFWEIIWLRPVIHQVWILVSNVVYFIFAIMLVVIALANIFWEHGGKTFALKAALPKLIMWVIMVPFTWFIVSATLSVTNVLTASVLSFSYDSIVKFSWDTGKLEDILNKPAIPKVINIDLTEDSDWEWGAATHKTALAWDYRKINCDVAADASQCLSLKDVLWNSNWAYNLLSYYAYAIFKIDTLKTLWKDQAGKSVNKVWDIFKKLTFGLLFALIFAILIIAIAFALITRMVMLWLYAMFSPVFALSFFLWWGWWKGLEKLNKKMNIKAFVSLAMVPVYVSAALSFWLILLSFAMNTKFDKSEYVSVWNDWKQDSNWDQNFTFKGWKGGKEVKLVIMWKYTEDASWVIWNTFAAWQWIISNVIISFLALIILWMAVMAALWASEITEKAVKPIADFWDAMWKLMVEAPKYIPLKIPGKDGKSIWISMMWLNSLQNKITWEFTASAEKQATEFANKIWLKWNASSSARNTYKNQNPWQDLWDWQRLKGYVNSEKSNREIAETLKQGEAERRDFATWLAQYMNLTWDKQKEFINNVAKSANTPHQLAEIIKSSGTSDRIIQWAFDGLAVKEIEEYLTSGKSDNSGWNSKVTKPELYPHKVTKIWNNVTMNITWINDKNGTSWTPINIVFDDKTNTLSKAKIREALEKSNIELGGKEWEKLIKDIIHEITDKDIKIVD